MACLKIGEAETEPEMIVKTPLIVGGVEKFRIPALSVMLLSVAFELPFIVAALIIFKLKSS